MSATIITVSATARREGVPDGATVEAVATGTGESSAGARAAVRDRVATVREAVDAVTAEQVRTTDLRVERTSEMFDPVPDAPFQATASLAIACSPDAAEQVVVEVTDGGGTVRGVEFELHEERRRALRDDALAAATERAREKAERVAAAEGLSITGVEAVSTTDGEDGFDSIVDEALEMGSETGVQPTPVEVVETVDAEYAVTS